MNSAEYGFYQTFFEIEHYRKIEILLKQENIDFRINDKSSQMNFRVPQSTFIEIDLFIKCKDIGRTEKLLTDLMNSNVH